MVSWVELRRISIFVWSFHVGGEGKFVFARRGNLGFALKKLLLAQQRQIAATFPLFTSSFNLIFVRIGDLFFGSAKHYPIFKNLDQIEKKSIQ